MRIVISDSMSRDGIVQASGGPHEDTDGIVAARAWITAVAMRLYRNAADVAPEAATR